LFDTLNTAVDPATVEYLRHFIIYLVIYLPGVAPTRLEERRGPLFTTRQKTIGLNGMTHEETHPCISCSCQSTFETVQTVDSLLIKRIPSVNDSFCKKVLPEIQSASVFG